jgi:hypothetical protein
MNETYTALETCARRRLSSEWRCSEAEREMLGLIVDLSFGLGQTWAVVPCLADFAAACGIHKSTACRALRAAVTKGYVQILQRQGETLYTICTATRGQPDDAATEAKQAARERLLAMNRTRHQGTADIDGQERLPGVFESEEITAQAAAFEAIIEEPATPPDPLEKLLRTMEQRRQAEAPAPPTENHLARPATPDLPPPSARMEMGSLESQWLEMTRGLKDDQLHCLEMIREECRQRAGGEAELMGGYRWAWRKRAKEQTRLYVEAAGVCKAMRLESGIISKSPCAFIYCSVRDALKVKEGNIKDVQPRERL